MTTSSSDGPRIPEGPEDMPGGPSGGRPITPPERDEKKKKKQQDPERDADDEE